MRGLAAHALLICTVLLSGCGSPPEEARRPSEPTDAFYPPTRGDETAYPPIRWHRREPHRMIVTKLRPMALTGRFPTAYLRSITHHDQPYAKTIWDVASAGISLATLAPLSVAKSTPWRRDMTADELVLMIGGYSSSVTMTPQDLVGIVGGRIERGPQAILVRESGGPAHYFFPDDLSGRPGNFHVLRCYDVCWTTLTIPMSAAGQPPLGSTVNPDSVTGLGVQMVFDVGQVRHWTRLKRTAVCFVASAVADFDADRLLPGGAGGCAPMRDAILRQRRAKVESDRTNVR